MNAQVAAPKLITFSEWQVNYKSGLGWEPIDEETMRVRLSMRYHSIDEVVELMRTDGDKFQADTAFAVYRRNPGFDAGIGIAD